MIIVENGKEDVKPEQIFIQFISPYEISNPTDDVATSDDDCACRSCGKIYKSKGNLRRHLTYECGRLPHICCPLCGFKTKHRSSMRRHVINRHPGHECHFDNVS